MGDMQKNRRTPTMSHKFHYLLALLLGLAAPGFMGGGDYGICKTV